MGKTISLGERSFESLRFDVGMEHDINFENYEAEMEETKDILSAELTELEKHMRLKHSDRAFP